MEATMPMSATTMSISTIVKPLSRGRALRFVMSPLLVVGAIEGLRLAGGSDVEDVLPIPADAALGVVAGGKEVPAMGVVLVQRDVEGVARDRAQEPQLVARDIRVDAFHEHVELLRPARAVGIILDLDRDHRGAGLRGPLTLRRATAADGNAAEIVVQVERRADVPQRAPQLDLPLSLA